MTIAAGVAKQVKYKVESTWGTAASSSGSQLLRRVSSDLGLKKAPYESQEIRSNYQRYDVRHGVRSIGGGVKGEMSPGTYKDFFAAAVRKAWASVTAAASLSLTIAGSGPTYTVTRGSGSWLSDGFKAGQVIRLSVGSLNAANISKNLWILSIGSATAMTVMPLNGVALVAEGPIATCTATVIGKTTYAPTTSHTDLSYTFEHYFSDLTLSEVFTGCKISKIDVGLPATGMSTFSMDLMGKDITTAGSEYFTSPTTETTTGLLAAVNGRLMVGGTQYATVTGVNYSIDGGMSAEPAVGSNTYGDIAEGMIKVSGSFTALFESATLRDLFINETESTLGVVLSASESATADFFAVMFPRIKVMSADKDDGMKSIVQSFTFEALYNSAGGAGTSSEQSTIALQDSQA
jgi:hypothetical protein